MFDVFFLLVCYVLAYRPHFKAFHVSMLIISITCSFNCANTMHTTLLAYILVAINL